MKFRSLLSFLFVGILVLGLTACSGDATDQGGKGASNATASVSPSQNATTAPDTAEPTDKPAAPQATATANATEAAKSAPKKVIPTSFTLASGIYSNGSLGLRVRFSQAMLMPEDVRTEEVLPPAAFPVEFSPALAGEGSWLSEREFVFRSYDRTPPATTFVASPRPGAVSIHGGPVTGNIATTPLPVQWDRLRQIRYTPDGNVVIESKFNARIDPAKLRAALTVATAKGDALPFSVEAVKPDAKGFARSFHILVKLEEFGTLAAKLPRGFTSEDGPAGFGVDQLRSVETSSMLEVREVESRQTSSPPWQRYIQVRTTTDVDPAVLAKFIEISPVMDFTVRARGGGFDIMGDFSTRPRVSLTLKKGLSGSFGHLTQDHHSTVIFKDFNPRLTIDTKGTVLSHRERMLVPLTAINVEKVQATLWQLPENSIPLMSMGFFSSYQKDLSRKVAVRSGPLNGIRNQVVESAIDLSQLAGKARGVFLLTVDDATDAEKLRLQNEYDYDDYYWYYEDHARVQKLVVISDLGIMGRVSPDSVSVWVNSISTNQAVNNARVQVFTRNNVLLASGRTDGYGLWHMERSAWGENERPALILVNTEATPDNPRDVAYLKLDQNLSADSAFDTGGRPYLRQGYEAYCFTPRGMYRPGETVDARILVRDARMQAPGSFPLAWKITASTGRIVGQGTVDLSANGGASVSLPLVPTAPTGKYSLRVSIPGQGDIGSTTFTVEEFAPPRIEVDLTPDKDFVLGQEELSVDIDARYLFGTPVADGPWEASLRIQPYSFRPDGWKSFQFPYLQIQNREDLNQTGSLDASGKHTVSFAPKLDENGPAMLSLTVRVREDGGRWVAKNVQRPYFSKPVLIGYERQREEAAAGTPYSLRLAAVTPQGKAADTASIKVVAELENRHHVRTDRGYSNTVEYILQNEATIPLKEGVGTYTFTPKQRGTYRLRFTDPQSGSQVVHRIHTWSGVAGSGEGASTLVDRVMLSWDKPRYTLGETARLTVRSPFTGKLLLVMESDREIYRQVIKLDKAEQTVDVPVLQALAPNAYASAWVIRPVRAGEVWSAHRAYGIIPLMVDHTSTRLDVAIEAPAKAEPRGQVPVTVRVTDKDGKPMAGEVTLSLVDEGLLALTAHKTPDPFAFFTAKRAYRSRAYDMYEGLMPLSSRKAMRLTAGGDGADDNMLAPMTRKLELLSIHLGSVTAGPDGVATTTLTLPEYSGRGRLMAVAATPKATGSTDANLHVSREVTVEATVPRMVAPGDAFSLPVFVFASDDKPVGAEVTVSTEGPLAVQGEQRHVVALDPAKPKVGLNLTVKALDASGMGIVRVTTAITNSTRPPFEQVFELPVRPPYPRIALAGSGVVESGKDVLINPGGGFYPGTQRTTLSVSDTPSIGLLSALDYLGSYPYGCLEQTTSSSWPYLAVPAMLRAVDPEKAQDSQFREATAYAVRRLLSMQRRDGGFNYWPGTNSQSAYPWGSVYATHFLTEARATGLVPEDALRSALSWMRSYLATPLPSNDSAIPDMLSAKAYICYVLALNDDAPLGWMHFLRDQGALLNDSARIFLAGAYARATGKADALRELGTRPFASPKRYGWSMESISRNEALRLLMWAQAEPHAGETALLAARVLEQGQQNRWYNTQENAMAVMALGLYAEKTATVSRDYAGIVSSLATNGQPEVLARFSNGQKPVFHTDTLLGSDKANRELRVSLTGPGKAFYSWKSTGIPTQAPEAMAAGIRVGRRWIVDTGEKIDFMSGSALAPIAKEVTVPRGAKVTVALYIQPVDGFNSLVLSDVLPGGFEIDNPKLVAGDTDASSVLPKDTNGKHYPAPVGFEKPLVLGADSYGVRTEMRDDRLLLFMDDVPRRPMVFVYTLRAVTGGTFVIPPLSAEAMYDPAIKAITLPGTVTIE